MVTTLAEMTDEQLKAKEDSLRKTGEIRRGIRPDITDKQMLDTARSIIFSCLTDSELKLSVRAGLAQWVVNRWG